MHISQARTANYGNYPSTDLSTHPGTITVTLKTSSVPYLETFNDNKAGCWKGEPIKNNSIVKISIP